MIFLFALIVFCFAEEPQLVQEWTSWLLQEHPEKLCVEETRCQWMGELSLEIAPDEASFQLYGRIDARGWVSLIGSESVWPINVMANEEHIPVIERSGVPSVFLEAGEYRISGTLIWNSPPSHISLPKDIAIISVQENGQAREFMLDENHRLLLQSKTKEDLQDYQLIVLRKLSDGIPLSLETRLVVRVSSKPQVVNFGQVISSGIELHNISSAATTWFDEQGNLLAQLPVGEHQLTLQSSIDASLATITLPPPPEKWPNEEYWVFESAKALRSIQLNQLQSIAADQTPTPEEWKTLPTYRLVGRTFSIIEYRRGNPSPPPNSLQLNREIWPRLTEKGYLIQDSISGVMNQDWHFVAGANLAPTKAESRGEPLSLMTNEEGATLISSRNANVQLTVESIVSEEGIPLTGWNTSFDSISIKLHIPPGWSLLYSSAPEGRTTHFSLLIVNLLLLLGSLFFKRRSLDLTESSFQTVVTLCTSVCAPITTAVWQLACGLLSVLRPQPLLSSLVSLIFLLGITLETTHQPLSTSSDRPDSYPVAEWEEEAPYVEMKAARSRSIPKKKKVDFQYQTPSYIVQMGTGTPQWRGETVMNYWPEGIIEDEAFSVLLLSKSERYLFLWFGFGAAIALFWLRNRKQLSTTAAQIFFFSVLGASSLNGTAQAEEFPSPETEKRLIERATQKECQTDCAEISLMVLNVTEQSLRIELEAHAQTDTYLPLPGPSDIWRPERVLLNGNRHANIREREDGFLELRLPKGVWNIELIGQSQDILQLQFQDVPHRTDFISEGWNIEGLENDGSIRQSILLQKQQTQNAQFQATPQLRLHRNIELGVEWQVSSRLERIGQNQGPIRVTLPLLQDEKIISGQHSITEDHLVIELGPDQQEVSWISLLSEGTSLSLLSNSSPHFSEHWTIRCGTQFNCSPSGVVPIAHVDAQRDWVLRYTPLPSEELTLAVQRFEAAPGKTYRLDQMNLRHHLGQYQVQSSFDFEVLASQSGTLSLDLPENAKLQSFLLNGESFPFSAEESIVIPFELGRQSVSLSWTLASTSFQRIISAPRLAESLSNINIHLTQDASLLPIYASNFWWKPSYEGLIFAIFSLFLALVLAKTPKSRYSFGIWLALSFSAIQLSLSFTFFWLGLFWLQQGLGRERWKSWAFLWLLLFMMMLIYLPMLFFGGATPTLFLSEAQNHWYIDLWKTDIPSITVLLLPRWVLLIGLLGWTLLVLKLFWDRCLELYRKET